MKKISIPSIILVGLLCSCSSVYQSGQTPDDVYFSPGKEVLTAEIRRTGNEDERYQAYTSTADNRFLRMRVSNRNRWRNIDDFSYWNDMRYDFSPFATNTLHNYNNGGWGNHPWGMQLNPWNIGCNSGIGINAWNNWYGGGWGNNLGGGHLGWGNPIYNVITYVNPKIIPATSTSGSNINAYRNRTYNNSNMVNSGKTNWYTPGKSTDNNSLGNLVKRVFTQPSSTSGNSNNNTYQRPMRTFGSSSNSNTAPSSNAGGSSGGFKTTGSSSSSGRAGRGN